MTILLLHLPPSPGITIVKFNLSNNEMIFKMQLIAELVRGNPCKFEVSLDNIVRCCIQRREREERKIRKRKEILKKSRGYIA